MRRSTIRNPVVIIAFASALLTGLWLLSPLQAQQNVGKEVPAQSNKISDRELRAFVDVYVRYHQIRQDYELAFNNSNDPSSRDRLQREANSEVDAALKKAKLAAADYNRIFNVVNSDKDLRQKALGLINDRRKES